MRNLRPVISRCATSGARAFCRASQLSSKKDCGGPYGKKLQSLRKLPAHVLFVASLTGKRIAVSHFGQELQRPAHAALPKPFSAEAGPEPCYQRLVRFIKAEAATCPDIQI